ncbi:MULTISPECIES: phage protein NinX family protein [unclassified Providencia]|uniref:phage protein NinX family protein n=1 Tax=unclassified Providencia TaxID=2633465 RepID=UPI0012B673DD|nr:phage protein NinX family protein [Providencia sp. PROV211]MTC24620.1 DUF2591 domain-containing protein [Providencia sp. wls1938]
MNKYTDQSDFEINKKVASHYLPCDYNINEHTKTVELICYLGDTDEYNAYATFAPCSNPASAWDLILDAKLSIHPDFNNDCKSWVVRNVHIPMVNETNLARAISIAYLLFKDVENETNNKR